MYLGHLGDKIIWNRSLSYVRRSSFLVWHNHLVAHSDPQCFCLETSRWDASAPGTLERGRVAGSLAQTMRLDEAEGTDVKKRMRWWSQHVVSFPSLDLGKEACWWYVVRTNMLATSCNIFNTKNKQWCTVMACFLSLCSDKAIGKNCRRVLLRA